VATIDMSRKDGGSYAVSRLAGRVTSNTMWPGPRSTSEFTEFTEFTDASMFPKMMLA